MPIKFRCNYCHQFLGISRNQAGGVFDCPTCGRTIRVPELDGSSAPLPPPELDGADAHLARALDELAALANWEQVAPVIAQEVEAQEEEFPQPLPEPVPVEIPVPLSQPSPVSLTTGATVAAEHSNLSAVLEELSQQSLAIPHLEQQRDGEAVGTLSSIPLVWLALGPVLCLVMGLGLGWVLGQSGSRSEVQIAQPEDAASGPGAVQAGELLASGRISFQAEDGQIQPDVGAGVLLLPQTWDAASRLSPIGLRPADSEADQRVAVAVAEAMSGGLTWTNADGEYTLKVPATGTYRLVVLSRLASRPDNLAVDEADDAQLSRYLENPEMTLGQRAYLVREVEVAGNSSPKWDHQFAP